MKKIKDNLGKYILGLGLLILVIVVIIGDGKILFAPQEEENIYRTTTIQTRQGNIIEEVTSYDILSEVTMRKYDLEGKPLEERVTENGNVLEITTYTYDSQNRPVKVENTEGTLFTFTYSGDDKIPSLMEQKFIYFDGDGERKEHFVRNEIVQNDVQSDIDVGDIENKYIFTKTTFPMVESDIESEELMNAYLLYGQEEHYDFSDLTGQRTIEYTYNNNLVIKKVVNDQNGDRWEIIYLYGNNNLITEETTKKFDPRGNLEFEYKREYIYDQDDPTLLREIKDYIDGQLLEDHRFQFYYYGAGDYAQLRGIYQYHPLSDSWFEIHSNYVPAGGGNPGQNQPVGGGSLP